MRALEHAYLACLGTRVDPVALWRSHRGGTLEDSAGSCLATTSRRFTDRLRDHYYGQRRDFGRSPGVEEVLAECLRSGAADGGCHLEGRLGRYRGAAAGPTSFASSRRVVGFDDTELHKPDPEPIFTAHGAAAASTTRLRVPSLAIAPPISGRRATPAAIPSRRSGARSMPSCCSMRCPTSRIGTRATCSTHLSTRCARG